MPGCAATYRRAVPQILISVLLTFTCRILLSQTSSVSPVPFSAINNLKLSGRQMQFDSLVRHGRTGGVGNMSFLDSLKERASKNRITRRIYDYVVVVPDTFSSAPDGNSESAYRSFSGKTIRKIEVRRLNVFGADINEPFLYEETRMRKFLNKTHISTDESIIRKNLLFSLGDTVSPVALSDNERVLRELPFIDDARIIVIPATGRDVDILVITKDIYSIGFEYKPEGIKKGNVSLFERNLFGMGHEIGIGMPYDNDAGHSPGFAMNYNVDNIGSTFINLNAFYSGGLGKETYGIEFSRKLISYTTKWAGGISIRHMYETVDLDTLRVPVPLRYNLQDYWVSRSFLLNPQNVTRLIIGARYRNNNVYDRPYILPDSYYAFQKYRILLGSIALSAQRYSKANLIYGYGKTEDIPYGALIKVTVGREINEFKFRNYAGSEISFSRSFPELGYIYSSAGLASYINRGRTEQGILSFHLKYFSELFPVGRSTVRNFIRFDYTRGFDRNSDEHLSYFNDNGFSGFRNDSVQGAQRITCNFESVVFSKLSIYGFRFAFFGFADFSSLAGTNQVLTHGTTLSGIGLGIRVRNDNLVFNTFQVRLGFFPDPPAYSRINYVTISGEQTVKFDNFEPGPPSMIPYR